jgi:hypothetical protein
VVEVLHSVLCRLYSTCPESTPIDFIHCVQFASLIIRHNLRDVRALTGVLPWVRGVRGSVRVGEEWCASCTHGIIEAAEQLLGLLPTLSFSRCASRADRRAIKAWLGKDRSLPAACRELLEQVRADWRADAAQEFAGVRHALAPLQMQAVLPALVLDLAAQARDARWGQNGQNGGSVSGLARLNKPEDGPARDIAPATDRSQEKDHRHNDPPVDGDRDSRGRIWLAGGWRRFGPAIGPLLVWILHHPNGDPQDAISDLVMPHRKHFDVTLGRLRKKLKTMFQQADRFPVIELDDELLLVWKERKRRAQKI